MIAFGPIPSRRLGKSLGINNIVSHKVCSYSCVYCQIGNTVNKSIAKRSFCDPHNLVKNVEIHLKKLNTNYTPDYLTFVANGEPTLDLNLGMEIQLIKKFRIPVAVITNASLIHDRQVQNNLMAADWVSVKIDTIDELVWQHINRPLAGTNFKKILKGLKVFAAAYRGKFNTETMLVHGYNDSTEQLKENASFIAQLQPQKAYLSIPIRPPTVNKIKHVSEEKLTEAWQLYQKAGLDTELLTGFEGTDTGTTGNAFEDILNITAVHPLREDSVIRLLKQNNTDNSVIVTLVAQRLIKRVNYNGNTYYIRNYHY